MNRALIVYGTRYGAAASTAEEIANVLQQQGVEARVVNAKDEKITSIVEYGLVIVGSGIMMNRWTAEPEKFLGKFKKELANKKLALFVCCGSATSDQPQAIAKAKQKYLEEKAAKLNFKPVALGLFGGVYNYNKVPWYAKKAMEMDRPQVEVRFKETAPGIYDTRDWNAIRAWARELAQKVK
jgi:menaquinone-dependent protoporphyrinogen IX oxidase